MNRRFFFGLALLLFAVFAIWLLGHAGQWLCILLPERCVVTVSGIGGGSKAGLLADPDVARILEQKYRIRVEYTKTGSLVLPDCSSGDFLWPGNEADVERCKQKNPKVSFDRIYQSPMVLYSWDEVVDALKGAGVARQEGDVYYTDVAKLLELNRQSKSWRDVGLPQLHGRVEVRTADPTAADSANVFAAYIGSMMLDEQVPELATIEPLLPEIKAYFGRQGYQEKATGDLWKSYVTKGMGAYPIIVAYESLGIELIQNEPNKQQLLQHVRLVYPEPTIWFSHPLIYVTDRGKLLSEALKDPEIQRIAWERHGFRSAVPGGYDSNPVVIDFPGVAPDILKVMPLPAPEVLDRMAEYLKN